MAQSILEGRSKRKILRGMFALESLFKASGVPGVSRWHPWLRPDKTDMRWLPINQDIVTPGDTPLPMTILDRFIEEASCRYIYDYCGCREAYGCKDYPVEIGCLLMGDSARESAPSVSHEASVDEARELVRRAVDSGLVPFVGKARVDNAIFGIKDRARLLTVCFCCECCCLSRFIRHIPLEHADPIFPRLGGITIEVGEECTGCGTCVEKCYIRAIEVVDKRAVIGDYCRACGRCATVCPRGAISVTVDDPGFVDAAVERIRSYVDYT